MDAALACPLSQLQRTPEDQLSYALSIPDMSKPNLDKKAKLMAIVLFLVALSFYAAFIAMNALGR